MRYKIEAGKYHQPAQLQKRQMGQNGYGETVEDWTLVSTIRCSVQPINGKEFFTKESVNPEITHRIRMRHTPSMIPTPDMRIVYMNRIFMITSVIDYMEGHNEIQMICKELINHE